MPTAIPFDNTYTRLPPRFFARVEPTKVSAPRIIRVNTRLAESLGIDPSLLAGPEGAALLSGNRVPEGAEPIAQAYAGHQFGGFSPQLGDGRAILLGEVVARGGARRDIQLKGSGPTPFSRRGDGRAALGPVLREYLISEAMAALGVPTTRALAAVTTGERVYRETALPGGVFTRVAASHIRVGTFQYFAARGDAEGVRTLADYVIARHYPEAATAAHPYRALLDGVIARQAALIPQWLAVGFIHGVMNTDNMAVSGETIDYGPCAFMDTYDPGPVFSSIDEGGRYAYSNQPSIAFWNLTRLAETLLPLLGDTQEAGVEVAQDALAAFGPLFEAGYLHRLRQKIGLGSAEDGDIALARDLLSRMAENGADFTLTFRRLCDAAAGPDGDAGVRGLFANGAAYDEWAVQWRTRLKPDAGASMREVNPAVIPRNHLVEEAIAAAVRRDDFGPFEALLEATARPFEDRPDGDRFAAPPNVVDPLYQTFCGT
jgi:uncharacterized protein YdiU (UPF0061 family)